MVITTSGTIATFKTKTPKPIQSLKVYFGPIQEGSGDPSPTNVRPISGRTGIEVIACGRNLFNTKWYYENDPIATSNGVVFTVQEDGSVIANGTAGSSAHALKAYLLTYSKIPSGNYYTTVGAHSSSLGEYPYAYDTTRGGRLKKWDSTADMTYASSGTYTQIQIPETLSLNNATVTVRHFVNTVANNKHWHPAIINSIENPNNASWEPYNARNLTVDWDSIAGEVAGGYIDLISGELVVTHKSKTYIGAANENWYISSGNNRFIASLSDAELLQYSTRIEVISNIGIFSSSSGNNYTIFAYKSAQNEKLLYYYPPSDACESVDVFKQWLSENNLQVVYKLADPIYYQLTPQQLSTLSGRNNIWGVNCDSTEVSYDFEELLDMVKTRQKVLRACQIYRTKLPPGYEEYDWCRTSGHNARFNTEVPGNDETLVFDTTFMWISVVNSYHGVFGNYNTENDHYCWRVILPNLSTYPDPHFMYVTMGNRQPGSSTSIVPIAPSADRVSILNKKFSLHMELGTATTYYGDREHTVTATTTQKTVNTNSIAVGATSVGSSGGTGQCRIYSFKIHSQGKLIRDYHPCIRLQDNKAGFYDMVNYIFKPSIGSADFVAGND